MTARAERATSGRGLVPARSRPALWLLLVLLRSWVASLSCGSFVSSRARECRVVARVVSRRSVLAVW